MGVNMVHITVSGHPGSGTSTLVHGLKERFGWKALNGGDVFRQEAKRRGLSLVDFGELCKQELEVDRQLDAALQACMVEEGAAEIVESRLAGWWAYKLSLPCVRLWLNVTDEERAARVAGREGVSFEDALDANRTRSAVDAQRFAALYGLQPEDPEPYTHMIDATSLNATEILEQVSLVLEDHA
jgi:cytidylate kinase